MDPAESAPSDRSPNRDETFCRYLAKQLVAKHGLVPDLPVEAREVADQSDCVLTDSNWSVIIGLIDRETNPGKAFTLSVSRLREIAEHCRLLVLHRERIDAPISIHLMEVGGATPDQAERLGDIRPRFLDNVVSAWIIDPQRATIWTTAGRAGRDLQNFIQSLLGSPREDVVAPLAIARRSFPWLTAAIITALAMIYAAEIRFGIGQVDQLELRTTTTLVAVGGLMGALVTGSGEWYRLFTAPLLHSSLAHIIVNATSLGVAGYVLEPLIGRVWFAALFVIGALSGALFSLALNPDSIVSVGASGAVMALFTGMLVVSRRFPKGAARTWLAMNAIYVLLPSLLPLSENVDYASHFGGALGGVVVGVALLALWPASEVRPRLRAVALAIGLAGFAACLTSGALAQRNYPVYELSAALAPQHRIPASETEWGQVSGDVFARYPRDPRVQFIRASMLLRTGDTEGAEQALRSGLAEEPVWRRAIAAGDLAERMHAMLALILVDSGRREEAASVAKPACGLGARHPLRAALAQRRLCAS